MRSALVVMLAALLVAGVLGLIGLAGLQRHCYDISWDLPHAAVRGFNASHGCGRLYSYYWFTLALLAVTIIGVSVMAATGLLAASAASWQAWLTVLAVLTIQGADSFLALKDASHGAPNNYGFARLAAAGWVLTALICLGLTFLLGWRPRKVGQGAGSPGGPIKF